VHTYVISTDALIAPRLWSMRLTPHTRRLIGRQIDTRRTPSKTLGRPEYYIWTPVHCQSSVSLAWPTAHVRDTLSYLHALRTRDGIRQGIPLSSLYLSVTRTSKVPTLTRQSQAFIILISSLSSLHHVGKIRNRSLS